jgi:3-oxoadipate enol-lactonase
VAFHAALHGLSDIGDIRSIDDHVDDLEALLDHFGFGKVVLCGLSAAA